MPSSFLTSTFALGFFHRQKPLWVARVAHRDVPLIWLQRDGTFCSWLCFPKPHLLRRFISGREIGPATRLKARKCGGFYGSALVYGPSLWPNYLSPLVALHILPGPTPYCLLPNPFLT